MARSDPSDSEPEGSENPTSEEEESEEPSSISNGEKEQEISAYEKQRLSRIAENKARMEAMGLSKIASSLMGSPQNLSKRKGKRRVSEDDEDYRPNDEDEGGGGDNNDDDDEDYDEEFLGNKASRSDKRKVKKGSTPKKKSSTPKKKASAQKQLSSSDYVDDDDELIQAIALSLQHSEELPSPIIKEKKGNARVQENTGRGKKKKSFTSRVQMTEDEMILHFFQFDESGKGSINLRDLQRVAVAHDFVWTDNELVDMINCFDSDGDGKLNLEDFRKIVSRCNMIRAAEHS